MKKLVIKIGSDMKKDLKRAFENPGKYGEPGAVNYYLKDVKELAEVLSPKRLELLRQIIDHEAEKKPIGELAKDLGRKQEAISRDASFLATQQLVKKVKKKREVYLKAPFKTIEIRFAGPQTEKTPLTST